MIHTQFMFQKPTVVRDRAAHIPTPNPGSVESCSRHDDRSEKKQEEEKRKAEGKKQKRKQVSHRQRNASPKRLRMQETVSVNLVLHDCRPKNVCVLLTVIHVHVYIIFCQHVVKQC